ncbi:hypothetical protein [Actinoplanes teichomyceticus]|uniref:4-amino-4-deoxy-L-arabinose transferase-like glycosyltransferase n=1 Tax=Actinoplanes teichomyceticus TaxID=1867 RepID=A0A561WNE8_ACTTI|nr:hypothetical protein [Actinoplanes teichomyceticus]TWG25401.1 hypothetical protein FHX34_101367 [Actinoplanes teichomyceticus]GIF10468.1 hypothetical protein Ate01nite_05000 [Actinoplanes teichomyceticus]
MSGAAARPDTGDGRLAAHPPPAPSPWRPVWRGIVLRSVLVPLIVLAPLVTLPPSADHRFNVYANGARYLTHPWEMAGQAVRSVPPYLELGNFRPLGRIVEWALDTVAFAVTDLSGLPANVALRLVSFAAAILLTLAGVVLAECVVTRGRPFAGPPSLIAAVLPFAAGGSFVAAGRASTTVLFGGLYFVTAALVLLVAAAAARTAGRIRLGARPGALAVALGGALAAFNEMAYLALPLATGVVLIRARMVLGLPWSATVRGAGARFAGLLWAGFLPVAVPVRAIIAQRCADGGCYAGSDVAVAGVLGALPHRLTAWVPPLMWQRAAEGPYGRTLGPALLLALLALLLLVRRFHADRPGCDAPDRRQCWALAATGLATLVPAAIMGALNAQVQQLAAAGWWGLGWRDSALTGPAGAMLTVALLTGLLARSHRGARSHRAGMLAGVLLLVVCAAVGAAANRDHRAAAGSGRSAYLHDRVAQEIADFDRSPAGNARRCALRAEFRAGLPAARGGDPVELRRFDRAVDAATARLAGRRFCAGAP